MATTILQFLSNNWMSLLTMVLTIIWLILEYKASMWLWPVGIILPIFWIIVSLEEKVYGNVLINTYYLITSIIGWIMWLKSKNSKDNGQITSIGRKSFFISLISLVVFFCLIFFVMIKFSGNSLYICALDAMATILSFIGMVWLSKKWWQHWFCWIIANTLYTIIFFINEDSMATLTFVISTIVAIFGLFKWYEMMKYYKIQE